ncbi:MAG: hypothetical protein IKG47_05510 [Oscillospiraceae bacterium]|nr:hypothetical protein [Clostridia bacterium]MBR3354799.1 hypothetical protein [Oscillospiraceae bacterium]
MKKQLPLSIRSIVLCCIILCSACIATYRGVEKPYLVDRTENWDCSVVADLWFWVSDIDNTSPDPVFQRLFSSVPPVSFDATITDLQDAVKASKEAISLVYAETVNESEMRVLKNKASNLWIALYHSYLIAFDMEGNLILCTNIDQDKTLELHSANKLSTDALRISQKFDISRISLTDLINFQNRSGALTEYCIKKLSDKKIPYSSAPVEQVLQASYELSKIITNRPIGYESDEFRIYDNQNYDAWIVLSCCWIAVFSKETGELVFVCSNYDGFNADQSVPFLY